MKNINDINFLDDGSEKSKIKTAPIVYGAFAFVICLVCLNYIVMLSSDINDLKAQKAGIDSQITSTSAEIDDLKKKLVEDETPAVEGEEIAPDTYQEDLDTLAVTMKDNYSPLSDLVIRDIQNASVDGTFYANYEVSGTYFIIKGYAQNSNQAANLTYNLRQSDYIEDVNINYLTLVAEMDTTKSLAYDLYEFEITGSIIGGEANE